MTDRTVGVDVSGGQIQGIVGAGSVVIENLIFNARPAEDPGQADAPIGPCPYPGLAYFGPGDADLFFGRDAAIARLTTAVERQSFTALVGASGSGKSSVVLAGLAPRLNSAGSWRFSHFRIGTELERNPFLALARALAPLYVASDSDVERLRNTKLLATSFAAGELTLRDVFADCRSRNKGRRILLIADQFEEAFTLVEEEAVRNRFIDVLLAGFPDPAADQIPDICLILTMRADFYGRALRHRPLADALQNHVENLGPMNREELQTAIVRPAEASGVTFDPGLVETLLDAVLSKPGGLPLMQFALREMWGRQERKRITRKSYDVIGGVEGALAQRAESVFAGLTRNGADPAMDKAFQRLFTRLVTLGEGQEDTRRVVDRAELGDDIWGLAQRLAGEENRLVVTNASSARETAEVVHEALIRNWPKLVDWINRDRAFQSWLRQIRGGIELWSASPDDDGPLLRGGMLAQAAEWLARRRDDLSAKELAYIEASVALRRRTEEEKEAARQAEIRQQQELTEAAQKLAEEQRRRARGVTIGLLGTAAALVASVVSGFFAYQQSGALSAANQALVGQTEAAVKATKAAETATGLARARLLATEARIAAAKDNTPQSLERSLLLATASLHSAWTQEGFETWAEANKLSLPRPTVILDTNEGPFGHVTFSRDGSLMAAAGKNAIFLFDARTLKTVGTLPQPEAATLTFSPDGRLLASGLGSTVFIWSVADRQLIKEFPPDGRFKIQSIAFDATAQRLAFSGMNYYARIFRTGSWTEIARNWSNAVLREHTATLSVAFAPGGEWLLAHGTRLTAWSLAGAFAPGPPPEGDNKVRFVVVNEPERHPSFLAFTADGSRLVSSGGLWRLPDAPSSAEFRVSDDPVKLADAIVATSADAGLVATTNLAVWQPDANRELARLWLTAPASKPALAFSPDGKRLVVGSQRLEAWDPGAGGVFTQLPHDSVARAVAASRNGHYVVTTTADGFAHVWKTGGGKAETQVPADTKDAKPWSKLRALEILKSGDQPGISKLAFSSDDRWLAASSLNVLKVYATDGWRELARTESKREIGSVAFTSDGRYVVMREADTEGQEVGIIATGSWQRTRLGPFGSSLPAISISPDGRFVSAKAEASCGGGRRGIARRLSPGFVRVWQMGSGEQVASLPLGLEWVADKVGCPDQDQGSGEAPSGNVQLAKDALSWAAIPLPAAREAVGSPDGRWSALKKSDSIDLIFEGGRKVPLQQPADFDDMTFAQNGRWLVTTGGDEKARVWALERDDMIAASCARLNANLSEQDWRTYMGDEPYAPVCPNLPVPKPAPKE